MSQETGSSPTDGAPEVGDETVGGLSRRNSTLVAAGILLSRVAGLVRERAVSHFLGLSFAADAYTVAFRIPNLMQSLLGEGVLSASFIPVYARLLDEGREAEAGRVAGAVASLLTVVVGVVVVLVVSLAGPLVSIITPGLTGVRYELAVTLTRITAPGIGLLVLAAWCLGVLNSHRRFFLSYVAPVLWNLAQIVALVTAGALLLADVGDPAAAGTTTLRRLAQALAVGTLVGGLLQLLVQLPSVRRLATDLRFRPDVSLPGVRDTLRAFGPVVAGRGGVQLLNFVEQAFASLLAAGALAALFKAQMLYVLPISLFGMSVAASELPDLSIPRAQERRALRARLREGMERIAFYVVPSIVGFVVLGDIIVGALFRTGSFDRADVVLVWLVLIGFCIGLLATTSSRLLQSALYGVGNTRGPALLAVVRVAGAAALGYVLMLQLDRVVIAGGGLALMEGASLPALTPLSAQLRQSPAANHLGAVGLAIGTGVFGWVEYRLLRRLVADRWDVEIPVAGGALRGIGMAAAAATAVALACRVLVGGLHPMLGALIAVPATGGVYVLLAHRLGVGEAEEVWDNVTAWLDRRREG